ncbi:MAG: CPXCG motif-containing cysteine-rich protein [Gammaproteobacteria bacterium]|nr:CPXCG motif-containing cysteine-rich protein [Gammaproteobacteria bacterium]NNC96621.1 CPXCG motif-containing cysteine-rich protein [Gammaproteobacteria bacterium]NNM14947.1 CPXCG motif-containing cysteine-rich protein [Gammaproteobacteria bacterium]
MQHLQTKRSHCPYCGESIELVIDTSIETQEYIEDCEVCCQPMIVGIQIDADEFITLQVRSENE